MSILTKMTSGRQGRAQKVVIYAPEGFGKSTLASQFPSPFFFDVEGSTSQMEVSRLDRKALPDLKTFESALNEVATERPCSALIVDTIDWLEQMALEAIIADADNAKIQGVEDFGYGKGYTILKERITILLARFDAVIASGVTVVLLAHSKVTKFEPPDGAGPYDRYELKLSKQVGPLIKEWADMLIFGNWRTQVAEKGKGENVKYKGVGGRERLMHCNRTAAWDAKNRHAMADVEKWEIAVIEKAFRAVYAPWSQAAAPAAAATTPAPVAAPVVEAAPAPEAPKAPEVAAPAAPVEPAAPTTPPVVTAQAVKNEAYDELARICMPHAEAVTAYLKISGKIKPDQDWTAMPADYATRVKKNPAGFLKQVGINGKAVA